MKKQRVTAVGLGAVIFILSMGLIASCGDNNNQANETETKDEVSPQTEQQAENIRRDDETMSDIFEVSLEGSNQVSPVTTEANGNATITLRGDSIHVKGNFSRLSSEYVASHIHLGAEDENGDPIQPLSPELGSDQTSGIWDASYQLSQDQISALKADSLYINVHSEEYSGGEIRGQLIQSTENMNM